MKSVRLRLIAGTAAVLAAAIGAFAALAYGVHPVMVEAVASAGERKTVLATALAFASLFAALGEAMYDYLRGLGLSAEDIRARAEPVLTAIHVEHIQAREVAARRDFSFPKPASST